MLKIDKSTFETIERQIYNRARDIDVALFNSLTDETSKEFVLDCLTMYMNNDGGFGSGLEIDNYNPNSSVYQTYEALRILDMLGFDSNCENELYVELVNKAGNYLYNRSSLNDNRWNPLVKTNNDHAHSEEYTYYENAINTWNFHPTAALIGFSLTMYKPAKAYYKKALKLIGFALSYFKEKVTLSNYDFISFNSLLGSLKKANLFLEEQNLIEAKLKEQALAKLDDSSFNIATMLSNCNLDGKLQDALDNKLDAIINDIKPHGLWEHTKGWGNTKYPEAESAALKWLGAESVNNLYILKKYGRLD